ncbi:hypothetical protein [Streptomyces sp. YGL11-2]|uniref:hypothetical protein n=1 Tax=Streptomyces sp. YGL11-2 TaxID=3414028 RepID=UPI003CE92CB4
MVDLLLGLEAQLTCARAGVAIGVLCSRLVFRRQRYALVAALALVMVTLFVKGLPLVNRLFNLTATTSDSAKLLAPVGGTLNDRRRDPGRVHGCHAVHRLPQGVKLLQTAWEQPHHAADRSSTADVGVTVGVGRNS